MSDLKPEHNTSRESDKRYFPRWEVDEAVSYKLHGDQIFREGKTKDISCAGACIVGDIPLEADQKVSMTIQLSKGTKIKVNAQVLWIKNTQGQNQMGVAFYDTSDGVQDSILQHAFEIDKDKVVKQWYKGWN